jgi:hypothetical protein
MIYVVYKLSLSARPNAQKEHTQDYQTGGIKRNNNGHANTGSSNALFYLFIYYT